MNIFETMSVPAIVAAVYAIVEILKSIIKSDGFRNYIPVVSAACGAAIGLIVYFGFPQIIIADNVIQAFVIGAVSGWASTGANQAYKKIRNIGTGGDGSAA